MISLIGMVIRNSVILITQIDESIDAGEEPWDAVMGGLAVATLLTLVFLPALYVAWFRIRPATTALARPTIDPRQHFKDMT